MQGVVRPRRPLPGLEKVGPALTGLLSGRLFTNPFEYLAKARFLKLIQQGYDGAREDFFERTIDSQRCRGPDIRRMEQRASLDCLINICQSDSFRRLQEPGTPGRPFLALNQLRLLKRGKDTANDHRIGIQLFRNVG